MSNQSHCSIRVNDHPSKNHLVCHLKQFPSDYYTFRVIHPSGKVLVEESFSNGFAPNIKLDINLESLERGNFYYCLSNSKGRFIEVGRIDVVSGPVPFIALNKDQVLRKESSGHLLSFPPMDNLRLKVGEDPGGENTFQVMAVLYNVWGEELFANLILHKERGGISLIDPVNNLPSGLYYVIACNDEDLIHSKIRVR